MAIDVCSEISSVGISPRISFSHDLNQNDVVPIDHYHRRLDASLLDSASDFDFCIGDSVVQEPSTADELFSDGKILPVEIKKKLVTMEQLRQVEAVQSRPQRPLPPPTTETAKKMRLKEFLSVGFDEEEKPASKSFWQFRRSSSLNCDTSRNRSLIRSLQFLSRSNSTGSVPNPKQTMLQKENQRQNSQKQPPSRSPLSSSTTYYSYPSSQKPPQKKNFRSYGDGVRISPVLNLPPPYISRATVGLFGFGSLFCNGKDKKKKKWFKLCFPSCVNLQVQISWFQLHVYMASELLCYQTLYAWNFKVRWKFSEISEKWNVVYHGDYGEWIPQWMVNFHAYQYVTGQGDRTTRYPSFMAIPSFISFPLFIVFSLS